MNEKIILESSPLGKSVWYELYKKFDEMFYRCKDYDPPTDSDGDCSTIKDHAHCFMYDPSQGYCPFIHRKN